MIFLPFLVFSALLMLGWYRKGRLLTPGNSVVLVWVINTGLAIPLNELALRDIFPGASLFLTANVGVCLLPWVFRDLSGPPSFSVAGMVGAFRGFCSVMATIGIIASVYFLPNILDLASTGVATVREEVYQAGFDSGRYGIYVQVASGVWLPSLVLGLYWYSRVGFKPLTLALFGGGMANVALTLAAAGRSGVSYATFVIIFVGLIFWNDIREHLRQNKRIFFLVAFLFLMATYFTYYVAEARDIAATGIFRNVQFQSRALGALYSIVAYFGESTTYFSEYWSIRWDTTMIYEGGRQFPFFFSIARRLGMMPDYAYENVVDNVMVNYQDNGLMGAVFSTHLREMILDFGLVGTSVFSLGYAVLTWWALGRYKRTHSLAEYVLLVFLGSFLQLGIFFSSIGSYPGNGMVLFVVGAYFMLRVLSSRVALSAAITAGLPRSVRKPEPRRLSWARDASGATAASRTQLSGLDSK